MRYFLSVIIMLLTPACVFSQNATTNGPADTAALKLKLKEYNLMLNKAANYKDKAQAELAGVESFKKQARILFDSATVEGRLVRGDKDFADIHQKQFNKLYNLSLKWTDKADSTLKVAQAYKDTADAFNAKAETFYKKISEEYAYIAPKVEDTLIKSTPNIIETQNTATYVIQLGAGKMDKGYFKKVDNVEAVTPSDGIKRYISGRFSTRQEALVYQKKMIALGFKDAFIRTASSLDY